MSLEPTQTPLTPLAPTPFHLVDFLSSYRQFILTNLRHRLQTHPNVAQLWIDKLSLPLPTPLYIRLLTQCDQAITSMSTIPDLSTGQIALLMTF